MVRQACPELAEGLTTSGRDPVRPEALEGRTGYLQSSAAEGLAMTKEGFSHIQLRPVSKASIGR